MLDRLFLNKLTKKGKIAYWIIQLGLDIILGTVLFGILDYTLDRDNDGRTFFIIGAIASLLISGLICLSIWRVPKEIPVMEENKKVNN